MGENMTDLQVIGAIHGTKWCIGPVPAGTSITMAHANIPSDAPSESSQSTLRSKGQGYRNRLSPLRPRKDS